MDHEFDFGAPDSDLIFELLMLFLLFEILNNIELMVRTYS